MVRGKFFIATVIGFMTLLVSSQLFAQADKRQALMKNNSENAKAIKAAVEAKDYATVEAKARDIMGNADKIVGLRIFRDADGKTNLPIADVDGEPLVVSQFTLYADTRKGRRPSFVYAADPGEAEELVEAFAQALETRGLKVGRGVFGAEMEVELVNDGPFTMWLDAETP